MEYYSKPAVIGTHDLTVIAASILCAVVAGTTPSAIREIPQQRL